MATIALFHSAYGVRSLERQAAERLRRSGHVVATPDLYGGKIASTISDALALRDALGWDALCQRAAKAVADLPSNTVLAGFSLGAGVAASIWPTRQGAAGLLLMHGIFPMPETQRPGLPMQVHLAQPDDFESEEDIAQFIEGERRAGSNVELFRYPGPGHLFTDATLPDYDAAAAGAAWERVERFLGAL